MERKKGEQAGHARTWKRENRWPSNGREKAELTTIMLAGGSRGGGQLAVLVAEMVVGASGQHPWPQAAAIAAREEGNGEHGGGRRSLQRWPTVAWRLAEARQRRRMVVRKALFACWEEGGAGEEEEEEERKKERKRKMKEK